MVDRSARVIAVYNGEMGGTRNTINYASDFKQFGTLDDTLLQTYNQKKADGYYQGGIIYLDINAENNGLMLFTMAHEVTHFIKEWNPEKFQTLTDFLVKEYAKNNVDMP